MIEPRDVILGRITAALAASSPAFHVPRLYDRRLADGVVVADLFAERLADYGATVRRAVADEVRDAIRDILIAHQARRIVIPADLPGGWIALTEATVVRDEPVLDTATLSGVDGVVTGCSLAIAETGTIVLDGGPGQGRRALSLLPDLHVCVVDQGQITGTVAEALEMLDPLRPLTWISGPSATSDIELHRVEGVHGPRRLEVILVAT